MKDDNKKDNKKKAKKKIKLIKPNPMEEYFEPILRLTKDLQSGITKMSLHEIRYLVDLYYQVQGFRKQSGSQVLEATESGEPATVIEWVYSNQRRIEKNIKDALDAFTDQEPTGMGVWAKAICGVGPVISSGLLAHINLEPWRCVNPKPKKKGEICNESKPCTPGCGYFKIPTVGHIWRFAGLDPTSKWEKKTKRPWNARLKVVCYYAGESFVKVQNKDADIYGKIFAKRRVAEEEANEAGKFADQAKAALEAKDYSKKNSDARRCYEQGKLPPAHLHSRARRWAVKIFLYHWFAEAYRRKYNAEPPKPYVIEHLGHTHMI